MGIVYEAPEPHLCQTPNKRGHVPGTVWLCDKCESYWVLNLTSLAWRPISKRKATRYLAKKGVKI